MESIYLIHIAEYIRIKENIIKIVSSNREEGVKISEYPEGSIILLEVKLENSRKIGFLIKHILKTKFEQVLALGSEYVKGDPNLMIETINETIKKFGVFCNNIIDINDENNTNIGINIQMDTNIANITQTDKYGIPTLIMYDGIDKCNICNYETNSIYNFEKHLNTNKHKKRVQMFSNLCVYCHRDCFDNSSLKLHEAKCGFEYFVMHKNKIEEYEIKTKIDEILLFEYEKEHKEIEINNKILEFKNNENELKIKENKINNELLELKNKENELTIIKLKKKIKEQTELNLIEI